MAEQRKKIAGRINRNQQGSQGLVGDIGEFRTSKRTASGKKEEAKEERRREILGEGQDSPERAEEVSAFNKSLIMQRTPPSVEKGPTAGEVTETIARVGDDAAPPESTQSGVIDTSLRRSPRRNFIDKSRGEEEEQLCKIKEILARLRNVAARQKTTSAEIKNGLLELEEAVDVIEFSRKAWISAERREKNHHCETDDSELRLLQQKTNRKDEGKNQPPSRGRSVCQQQRRLQQKEQKQLDTGTGFCTSEGETLAVTLETTEETPRIDETRRYEAGSANLQDWEKAQGRRKRNRKSLRTGDIPPSAVASNRRKKKRDEKQKTRPDAIIIKPTEGRSYAQVLKEIRSNIKPEDYGTDIKAVKQTRAGEILLQMGNKEGNKEAFYNNIREVLKDQATTRVMEDQAEIEIHDLDEIVTSEEVEQALKCLMEGREFRISRVTLINIRRTAQQMAIVTVGARTAKSLLSKGNVKIGWVNCRIKRRIAVIRCFACFGFGHYQRDCKGPNRKTDGLCIRCGERGHIRSKCINESRCILCVEKGLTDENVAHVLGSGGCSVFREALLREKGKLTRL